MHLWTVSSAVVDIFELSRNVAQPVGDDALHRTGQIALVCELYSAKSHAQGPSRARYVDRCSNVCGLRSEIWTPSSKCRHSARSILLLAVLGPLYMYVLCDSVVPLSPTIH